MSKIATREYREGDYGNNLSFVGNLGKDPEMSYTPNGKAKTTFSVAVWQGKEKPALWLNCTVWEDLAEESNAVLSKGVKVKCVGFLSCRKWQEKTYYEVTVSAIEIIKDNRTTTSSSDLDSRPY